MKFLVLALCVCAASAASFPSSFGAGTFNGYKKYPSAPVAPVAVAAKEVVRTAAPVFIPVATAADAGANAYQAAKLVVNKAYSNNDGEAQILRSESNVAADGFNYLYETGNGISGEVTGAYKQVGEGGAVVQKGAYRYTAPDGTSVVFSYIADENGYQPQSDLLPVGPAIPEAIRRAIEYTAAKLKETGQKY